MRVPIAAVWQAVLVVSCSRRFVIQLCCHRSVFSLFFFFNDTATTEIYTLSLHDALPICVSKSSMSYNHRRKHQTLLTQFRFTCSCPPPAPKSLLFYVWQRARYYSNVLCFGPWDKLESRHSFPGHVYHALISVPGQTMAAIPCTKACGRSGHKIQTR